MRRNRADGGESSQAAQKSGACASDLLLELQGKKKGVEMRKTLSETRSQT